MRQEGTGLNLSPSLTELSSLVLQPRIRLEIIHCTFSLKISWWKRARMSPFVTFLGTIKITYPVIWKMYWHMENSLIKVYGHSSWRTFLSLGKLGPNSIVRAKVFQRASFFLSQVSGPILCAHPPFHFPWKRSNLLSQKKDFYLWPQLTFVFPSLLGESLSKMLWSNTCWISCCFLELTEILVLEIEW